MHQLAGVNQPAPTDRGGSGLQVGRVAEFWPGGRPGRGGSGLEVGRVAE